MEHKKRFVIAACLLGFLIFTLFLNKENDNVVSPVTKVQPSQTSAPVPTKYQFPYKIPEISKNRSYRIVVVGDSIVKALGPNANSVKEELIKFYPDSEFVIYNYGYPSTNIITVLDRLTKTTVNESEEKGAILNQGFEIIILESFGYNPLSENTLEAGLKKQEEVLEKILDLTLNQKPGVSILFMTPIAPDPLNFAKTTYKLSQEQRNSWVEERVSYIQNFEKFGKNKGIPVIDIYRASLDFDGVVNRSYISGDYIHPSDKGIQLMSREIAKFIFENRIIPL